MAHQVRLALVVLIALGAQTACGDDDPIAPEPFPVELAFNEDLPLDLEVRRRNRIELLPMLGVTAVPAGIEVRVQRPDLACTLATAEVERRPGLIIVSARVGGDPLAFCEKGWVVQYAGTVPNVSPGSYEVRVYEALGSGEPRFIGSRTVQIGP